MKSRCVPTESLALSRLLGAALQHGAMRGTVWFVPESISGCLGWMRCCGKACEQR